MTSRKVFIDSFKPVDIIRMYHLPLPHKVYDKAFVEKFATKNEEPSKAIKQCRENPSKNKMDRNGMYSVASLIAPYLYIVAMLCRLLGTQMLPSFQWNGCLSLMSLLILQSWIGPQFFQITQPIISQNIEGIIMLLQEPFLHFICLPMSQMLYVSFFLFQLWDGSRLLKIPCKSMCTIKLFGNIVSMNISIRFVKGLCSLFIRISLIRKP